MAELRSCSQALPPSTCKLAFQALALAAVCAIGFADMYSYSMPDSFLGQVLAQKGASSPVVTLALGLDGLATCIMAIPVLLCQSVSAVSTMGARAKWWLVIGGQAVSVVSSALPAVWPSVEVITACRAAHGAATAVYMVYCLILLVENTPKKHLALGIAVLSAGCSAGDSIGPVLGAVVFDKGGLQAAFTLQTAISTLPLLLALAVLPFWAGRSGTGSASSSSIGGGGSGHCKADSSCAVADTELSRASSNDSFCIKVAHCQIDMPEGVACIAASPTTGLAPLAAVVLNYSDHNQSDCSSDRSSTAEPGVHSRYHHMDSAHDLEALHQTAAAAAAKHSLMSLKGSPPSHHDQQEQSQEIDNQQQEDTDQGQQQQQQQDQHQRLDMASVLDTVRDWVVASQCLLVFLEQAVTSSVLVVLPVVMDTPTWLVGVVYTAMVVGAVAGPFALEAYLSRKQASNIRTYHLACGISLVMGVSSTLLIPLSWSLPALSCLLFVFGITQATTETLVYIHVAERLDQLGKHVATHVSMCMYLVALALGAGVGNMAGGALQGSSWAVQVGVICALAGTTSVYGAALSLYML